MDYREYHYILENIVKNSREYSIIYTESIEVKEMIENDEIDILYETDS